MGSGWRVFEGEMSGYEACHLLLFFFLVVMDVGLLYGTKSILLGGVR